MLKHQQSSSRRWVAAEQQFYVNAQLFWLFFECVLTGVILRCCRSGNFCFPSLFEQSAEWSADQRKKRWWFSILMQLNILVLQQCASELQNCLQTRSSVVEAKNICALNIRSQWKFTVEISEEETAVQNEPCNAIKRQFPRAYLVANNVDLQYPAPPRDQLFVQRRLRYTFPILPKTTIPSDSNRQRAFNGKKRLTLVCCGIVTKKVALNNDDDDNDGSEWMDAVILAIFLPSIDAKTARRRRRRCARMQLLL